MGFVFRYPHRYSIGFNTGARGGRKTWRTCGCAVRKSRTTSARCACSRSQTTTKGPPSRRSNWARNATVRRALTLASRCRRKYRRTRSRSGVTHNAPTTLNLRCERVRWRMMGVAPRSAQPRRTKGAIRNAHSPMNTSQAFRREAFFYPGPFGLDPSGDGRLVALQGASCGLLRTPAQAAHQPPDVIDVSAHAETFFDSLCDARTGPQIRRKARGNCAFEQQSLQLLLLSIRQFGRSPGGGFGPQGLGALLAIGCAQRRALRRSTFGFAVASTG